MDCSAHNLPRVAPLQVEHGFRLPSAVDHRPLTAAELWGLVPQALFVSATPARQELAWAAEAAAELPRVPGGAPCEGEARGVEMDIRPTGVLDPTIEVRAGNRCNSGYL